MMQHLVFLLEEQSAREMLQGIVPRLIPATVQTTYIVFEGKQDLEHNLQRKIRNWQMPNTTFVVLRDQDSGDCIQIKQHLKTLCVDAGQPEALVRIACHELETFYLGDLAAVFSAYQLRMPSQASKKFRTPDNLANAAEEIKKVTNKQYQKIDGSRRIAPFLRLDGCNCSHSFNVLCDGLRRLVTESPTG